MMFLKMIDRLPPTVEFLSEEDRARLDAAVLLYNQTITGNAQRRYERQSPRDRKRYAIGYVHQPTISDYKAKLKEYKADPVGKWWAQASSMAHLSCGGVYKSSLLHRLLQGKAPLDFPPPCSYSYPWYSVVEDAEPQVVTNLFLGNGVRSLGSLINGVGGAHATAPQALVERGITQIIINQTGYLITDANQAGIDLLVTISKMYETPDAMAADTSVMNAGDKKYPIITANHPLVPKIEDAYARGPAIFVKHGNWPGWRLFVAPQEPRSTDAEWGKKMLTGKMFTRASNDRGINPLDLIFEGINARLMDKEELEVDEHIEPIDAGLERINKALNGRDPRVEEVKQPVAGLIPSGLAFLDSVPKRAPRERVVMQWDVWHIERVS